MASADSTPKDDKSSTLNSIKTAKDLANLKGTVTRHKVTEEGCPDLCISVQPSATYTFIGRFRNAKVNND